MRRWEWGWERHRIEVKEVMRNEVVVVNEIRLWTFFVYLIPFLKWYIYIYS